MTAQHDGSKVRSSGEGPLDHTGVVTRMRTCRLLAVTEAAQYLGVSVATIERLVFRGALPIVKVGSSTRYDLDDLDAYIETHRHRNRRRTP